MGVINPENMLSFQSSQPLFDAVKKRLSSFDNLGLIDDGDFYDHVYFVIEELGIAAYKECQAVIPICNGEGKLPKNFRVYHATFKCHGDHGHPPSINEQKPLIYYMDTEVSQECPNKCCIDCVGDTIGKTKIVIRTFVNGEDNERHLHRDSNPMILSPNVRVRCSDSGHHHHRDILSSHSNEITITDDKKILVNFKHGEVYMQYYGLPFDENELPMVPDQSNIQEAIKYRIYSQLFEEFLWNTTVPGIGVALQDARGQYEFQLAQSRYWAKLPSFQKLVQSIRRERSRNKFWYALSDRTMVPGTFRR